MKIIKNKNLSLQVRIKYVLGTIYSKIKWRKPPRRVYKIGGGWGNRIEFSDWEKRRVVGWKAHIPERGDRLIAELTMGMAKFRFASVERCSDPPDMFFATLEDEGYLE